MSTAWGEEKFGGDGDEFTGEHGPGARRRTAAARAAARQRASLTSGPSGEMTVTQAAARMRALVLEVYGDDIGGGGLGGGGGSSVLGTPRSVGGAGSPRGGGAGMAASGAATVPRRGSEAVAAALRDHFKSAIGHLGMIPPLRRSA